MTKACAFGKEVKKALIDLDKSQEWLITEVKADTGLYFDSGYLGRILRGDAATPRIVASIKRVLNLPSE